MYDLFFFLILLKLFLINYIIHNKEGFILRKKNRWRQKLTNFFLDFDWFIENLIRKTEKYSLDYNKY